MDGGEGGRFLVPDKMALEALLLIPLAKDSLKTLDFI